MNEIRTTTQRGAKYTTDSPDVKTEKTDLLATSGGEPSSEESALARCVAVENGPIYAQEHMREGQLFTSIPTLTFRTWR